MHFKNVFVIEPISAWSKPVLTLSKVDFRSTPNNGHHQTGRVGPVRA
jgi:hypothetical protein